MKTRSVLPRNYDPVPDIIAKFLAGPLSPARIAWIIRGAAYPEDVEDKLAVAFGPNLAGVIRDRPKMRRPAMTGRAARARVELNSGRRGKGRAR